MTINFIEEKMQKISYCRFVRNFIRGIDICLTE